jgi:hypothetical protein
LCAFWGAKRVPKRNPDFWTFRLAGRFDVNVLQIDAWTHRVWLKEILRHWELRDLRVASDGHDEVAHLSELAP